MKKILAVFCAMLIFLTCALPGITGAAVEFNDTVNAKAALLMEADTGRVLFEQNADQGLTPASVTKTMTLLLVMEAIQAGKIALSDMVTTSANAASMGGTQIYLEEHEQMTVEDMVKSVVIASANDACVALAEHLAGSETSFVAEMNNRAKQLGLTNTNFENTNGLDDTTVNHVMSARDIAVITQELLKHPTILKYTGIWMDTVRNGEFGLTNTNRLIRYYQGANGMKTGSTSKAGFCVSATAKRGDMQLIAVIMGSPSRDIRNAEAAKLLDFGFANYGIYKNEGGEIDEIDILGGVADKVKLGHDGFSAILDKSQVPNVVCDYDYEAKYSAPVQKNGKLGEVIYYSNGEEIGRTPIYALDSVDKISFFGVMFRIFKSFLGT